MLKVRMPQTTIAIPAVGGLDDLFVRNRAAGWIKAGRGLGDHVDASRNGNKRPTRRPCPGLEPVGRPRITAIRAESTRCMPTPTPTWSEQVSTSRSLGVLRTRHENRGLHLGVRVRSFETDLGRRVELREIGVLDGGGPPQLRISRSARLVARRASGARDLLLVRLAPRGVVAKSDSEEVSIRMPEALTTPMSSVRLTPTMPP